MQARSLREIVRWLVDEKHEGNQSALAAAIDSNRGQVSRWCSGKDAPDFDSVQAIGAIYPELLDEMIAALKKKPKNTRRRKAPLPKAPPADLAPLWDRLDNRQRTAVLAVAEAILEHPAGAWLDGALGAFKGVASTAPPLPNHKVG